MTAMLAIIIGAAAFYLLIALVGTAAGWWDWLGLVSGDDDD